jgi:outer membrane immunogenic protein
VFIRCVRRLMLKYITLAAAGLAKVALSSPSSAADLSPRISTKAPVLVDLGYNWTGSYFGANGDDSEGHATLLPGTALALPAKPDVRGRHPG